MSAQLLERLSNKMEKQLIFNETKLKQQLKMAAQRFQMMSNKKLALVKGQKIEIARLLAEKPAKEEKALIRAEHLIREENEVEAYDIIQLECEILVERAKLIQCNKKCPPDLESCVSTLIWASSRVDVSELMQIRKQFRAKYGRKFENNALMNTNGVVNGKVFAKLSLETPSDYVMQTCLENISEERKVDWKPSHQLRKENDFKSSSVSPITRAMPVEHVTIY
mmetsp:Transcript_25102/g.36876  ORF Transcript_25102/g.36876 Transcript_25102/m.36876 type:complete len:223 (-) Transcript_25102:3-671(-)